MWRHLPEWLEAQRRNEVSTREKLNEALVERMRKKTVINLPLMDVSVIDEAIETWGYEKQLTQLVEECGEFIVEAMHLLYRPDRHTPLDKVLVEVVGVRIACDHVIRLHHERCEEIYCLQVAKEINAMRKANAPELFYWRL